MLIPELSDWNYPLVHRVVHYSVLNTMNKNFASNLLSQGSIEQDNLPKNVKKIEFLGCLIKASISVLNVSSESAKQLTIFDLLFHIAICSPKNDNECPSEIKN